MMEILYMRTLTYYKNKLIINSMNSQLKSQKVILYIDRLIIKFIWRGKKLRIANTILKKNKVWRLMLLNVKTYYKATVIPTVFLAKEQTNRSMEQNREPKKRPSQTLSTDLWQRSKDNAMEKRKFFQQMVLEQQDIPMKKKNPDTELTSLTKINSKWITNLKVKCKTIKLLGYNRKRKSRWP